MVNTPSVEIEAAVSGPHALRQRELDGAWSAKKRSIKHSRG